MNLSKKSGLASTLLFASISITKQYRLETNCGRIDDNNEVRYENSRTD